MRAPPRVIEGQGRPIRLREDLIWRAVENEVLVLDRRTWRYVSINASGAALWPQVVTGASRHELAATLMNKFDLDEEQALADVDGFVDRLAEHALLAAP